MLKMPMQMKTHLISLFLILLILSMNAFIVFASTTNGILQADVPYKSASSGEEVQFNINVVNNEVNNETFLIHHVWEGSVLWLPMELMDNQVYDYSPFGNHGSNNGTVPVEGLVGSALSFDGQDDYVEVFQSASLDIKIFSFFAWINPTNLMGIKTIVDKTVAGAAGHSDYLFRIGDNNLQFQYSNGTAMQPVSVSAVIQEGWQLVGFTINGTRLILYHNGVAYERTLSNELLTSGQKMFIGKRQWVSCPQPFNGSIDAVSLFNRDLTEDEIKWFYNCSWSERLSKYNVELGPGESTPVAFKVIVPEDAKVGHLQNFLLTAFSLSNTKHVETQTITVEVLPNYGFEMSLDKNETMGKPGELLNFQAALRNIGNVEDTFDISAEGGVEWNLSLSADSVTVLAGKVGSFNVSVSVPLDALPGDYTSFRIQATSRGNQNSTTNVNGTAIATAIYHFNITADPELRQVSPGSEAIFSLEINNLGTAPDTITLEAENLIGWDIKVEPSSQSLEIGETGKATVRVKVPEDALIGQTNAIIIHTVSSGDPTVSAISSISIEVVTPFWNIPDVRFLVGLSIGVLVGATLISTIILRHAQINRKENRRS